MSTRPATAGDRPIVHIGYSGIGGVSRIALSLALTAHRLEPGQHHLVFHGVEVVSPRLVERAEAAGLAHSVLQKQRGLDLAGARRLQRHLLALDPRLVLSHVPAAVGGLTLLRRRRPDIPVVSVEQHPNWLKNTRDWGYTLLCHRMADLTLYLSESYKRRVASKLGRAFDPSRCALVFNGIEVDRYRPAETAEIAEPLTIGMHSRFVPVKDHATLLRACAQLPASPRWRLELAGDGPTREQMQGLTHKLGILDRVEFLGSLDDSAVAERLQSWQIYAMVSKAETQSRALIEAQASGLAIVATEAEGVSDAVRPGVDALLTPAGDASALASALSRLLTDPARRRQLGQSARAWAVNERSLDASWRRYGELLTPLMA